MSFLGLDIGTSGCKAVVFDRDGKWLASAAREYAVLHSQPGWAELDSRAVGKACFDSIRESAACCKNDPIEALTISSQGEAFTVLDNDGGILANAMVSSDSRAADLCQKWTQDFGAERLYSKTGHTPHPIFSIFKLLWLARERPDLWKRAARFLCFEDYLHHQLGIKPSIGWSLAGRTMLFNIRERRWDPEILDAVGIRAEQLATPVASGQIVGIIPDAISRTLGLGLKTRVVAGGHDQVCAALGAGALSSGQATLAIGTVECLTVAVKETVFSPDLRQANLCTYAHAAPGLNATLAYNLTGGNLLCWYRDQWAAAERAEANLSGADVFELILQGMTQTPSRLMVLPYFTSSGTPHFDAHTPAAILGLRLDTTRGEVLRGLLEGLAFELQTNLALLERSGIAVKEIRAVGGGAKNRSWLQLKADVLNRPILRPVVTEAGCLGNALLACAAMTGADLRKLLVLWVPVRDTIKPDPERAGYYAERASAYAESYDALHKLARQIF